MISKDKEWVVLDMIEFVEENWGAFMQRESERGIPKHDVETAVTAVKEDVLK